MSGGEIINDPELEARTRAVSIVGYCRRIGSSDPIEQTAEAVGAGYWTIWNLYHGRRKSVPAWLLEALRRECRKIIKWQAEVLVAEHSSLKAESGENAFENLDAAVARVVEAVRLAREKTGDGRD